MFLHNIKLAAEKASPMHIILLIYIGQYVISVILINQWLESVCRLFEFGFVNFWLKFESRDDWFLRDGLHLTKEGARVLARGVNRAVKDFCSLN